MKPISVNTIPEHFLLAASISAPQSLSIFLMASLASDDDAIKSNLFTISSKNLSALIFSSSLSYLLAAAIELKISPYPPRPPSDPSHLPFCQARPNTNFTSSNGGWRFSSANSMLESVSPLTSFGFNNASTSAFRASVEPHRRRQISAASCPVPAAEPQFHFGDTQPDPMKIFVH
eukprot:903544_1